MVNIDDHHGGHLKWPQSNAVKKEQKTVTGSMFPGGDHERHFLFVLSLKKWEPMICIIYSHFFTSFLLSFLLSLFLWPKYFYLYTFTFILSFYNFVNKLHSFWTTNASLINMLMVSLWGTCCGGVYGESSLSVLIFSDWIIQVLKYFSYVCVLAQKWSCF